MRVMIHQPEYLPWPNLFCKILVSDVVVFLDNVQYARRSFQNRNMIKTSAGAKWLSVPLCHCSRETLIQDIEIDEKTDWRREHLDRLYHAYQTAPYFTDGFSFLEQHLPRAKHGLSDLNVVLIEGFAKALRISTRFILASSLRAEGQKSELILDICRKAGANVYVAGDGSRTYLDENAFAEAAIQIDFVSPVSFEYEQRFPNVGFIADLSIVDYVFNSGFQSFVVQAHDLLGDADNPNRQ